MMYGKHETGEKCRDHDLEIQARPRILEIKTYNNNNLTLVLVCLFNLSRRIEDRKFRLWCWVPYFDTFFAVFVDCQLD